MKRGIITNNEQGIHISDGEVWMTAWEIADLFYTTAGAINSRIKAILKAQQNIEMNKARMGKRCMDLFTRGVKEGVFQEGINFEIMALLVKEQTKMLRPSNVFCKHSITEVYNTILLTFLKGISTEKGRAILDRFDLKQSYDL